MNKSMKQSWFCEKSNKFDILSFKVIKKQREIIQINKIRPKEDITTGNPEIHKDRL